MGQLIEILLANGWVMDSDDVAEKRRTEESRLDVVGDRPSVGSPGKLGTARCRTARL